MQDRVNNVSCLLVQVILLLSINIYALTTVGDQQYEQYLSILNPKNYTQIEYSTDQTLLFIYDRYNNFADVYSGYNYTTITNQLYPNFAVPPNSISYFVDTKGLHNFLYGTNQGDIFRKQILNDSIDYRRLWIVEDEETQVVRAIASPDQKVYGAYCKGGRKVYIGDLEVVEHMIKQLNYTEEGEIRSIRWRSNTNQLAVSGGNITQSYFLLYDYLRQTETDISPLVESVVVDVAFSNDGQTMYYIEQGDNSTSNEIFVKVWDFEEQEMRYLVAAQSQELKGVSVRGNFVTAWDYQYAYVWDRVTQLFYGQYQSQLTSSGLSPDGSELITLTLGPTSHITIHKLCKDTLHVYDPLTDQCTTCVLPCAGCFLQRTHCSACIAQYYLTPTFACQECLENCQVCTNSTTCVQCLSSYYPKDNKCLSCAEAITGCILCDSEKYCTFCQWDTHWVLNQTTHSCQCATGYVSINYTCQACPKHCLQCDESGSCKVCDYEQHWVTIAGYCVCIDGYYSKNDACQPCQLGCLSCNTAEVCQVCDKQRHWFLANHSCVCDNHFTLIGGSCQACSSLMEGCSKCNSKAFCISCLEGYELNEDTQKCEPTSDHTFLIIIGAIVGGLLVIGVLSFLLRRYLQKKQSKKMQTLLQSQETAYIPQTQKSADEQ